MSDMLADELHAFIAAAPHKYPGHLIELFDRAEKALRRCSADSAQPEVWMWRATVGGVWGSWRLLDQPIDEFKKSAWGFNLGNGTAEVRALYARPERTEPQTAAVPASVDEIERIIRIEFHAMPEAARHAAERVYNFLDARISLRRAKTLARQTTTSGLPHCEGQAVECDGGLHSQAVSAKDNTND